MKGEGNSICALITDFGSRDYFVGVMKGVIKRIAPFVEFIDICHELPSYDILPACFALEKSYPFFSSSTIFMVVVDPGVGTDRKLLLVEHGKRFYIGPDNGVLTPILRKEDKRVSVLDRKKYFLVNGSSTFEARDKMAPAAAFLALGVDPHEMATPTADYVINTDYFPTQSGNTIHARIAYIDKFGNLMTTVKAEYLADAGEKLGLTQYRALINGVDITPYRDTYAPDNGSPATSDTPFLLLGSHGNVEIALNRRSAAEALDAKIGNPVTLTFY
ncbi:MAG: S-adenosyl-l-methionine hydroxide adenosyltransferase family protein [Candidatus Omnitrophota bacterium]